nr:MAG TPA: THROMBIN, TRIABIN THROMBIN, THROMBIN INHIBITOR, COMPLEX.6A [Caudoviricetes sp.]
MDVSTFFRGPWYRILCFPRSRSGRDDGSNN